MQSTLLLRVMLDYLHMGNYTNWGMTFERDEMDVLLEVVQVSKLNHKEKVLAFDRVEY